VRLSFTFWLLLVAILAAGFYLVMPKVCGGCGDEGRVRTIVAHADINGAIESALHQYKVDTGAFPKGSNGLLELVQQPKGATNWHGPYLDLPKVPVDPWGNNYVYDYPGKHNANGYDLFSAGPDGRIGTKDDIGNWTK
jgi:general secretion pathway protein G